MAPSLQTYPGVNSSAVLGRLELDGFRDMDTRTTSGRVDGWWSTSCGERQTWPVIPVPVEWAEGDGYCALIAAQAWQYQSPVGTCESCSGVHFR